MHLGIDAPLCIERVLRIGDEFRVFSRFYVDASRLPAFERLPLYFQTLWIPPNGRRLHLPGDGRDLGLVGAGPAR